MIYLVLVIHWIADFICQTRQMANNKSTSLKWLSAHISTYTLIMCVFGIKYASVNGLVHMLVDFCTSRGTSYFWKKQNVHAFFIVIGFDQLLHTVVLIATLPLVGWSL